MSVPVFRDTENDDDDDANPYNRKLAKALQSNIEPERWSLRCATYPASLYSPLLKIIRRYNSIIILLVLFHSYTILLVPTTLAIGARAKPEKHTVYNRSIPLIRAGGLSMSTS